MSVSTSRRRRRLVPIALISGVAATALLSLSMTGVLAGFSATLINPSNTASSATLLLSETMPTQTACYSTAAATQITTNSNTNCLMNNYASTGSTVMTPGVKLTSSVTIKNDGSGGASGLTLTPGACVTTFGTPRGAASDLCAKMYVTIQEQGQTKCVFPVSATAVCATTPTSTGTLGNIGTAALASTAMSSAATKIFDVTIMLDSTADNSYQGLIATQPLTWTLVQ
jgi:hypothetical protein